MIELPPTPKFLSDFDGTAVRKYGYKNPRNWLKYPLPRISGYLEFLGGVQEADIDFEGVVTVRKEFWRRRFTNRSLRKLGYTGVINPSMINYAGTEEAKGRFVAEKTEAAAVGMIDDKPHKIGMAVLDAVEKSPGGYHHPLLLGVVAHDQSAEHINEFMELAEDSQGDLPVTVDPIGMLAGDGFTITKGPLTMHVVQLEPYSNAEGVQFGETLVDLAAA